MLFAHENFFSFPPSSLYSFLAGALGETVVWTLFLPRLGSGKKKVWSLRVEYSLRVQRIGSKDQHEAIAGILSRFQCKYFSVCTFSKMSDKATKVVKKIRI